MHLQMVQVAVSDHLFLGEGYSAFLILVLLSLFVLSYFMFPFNFFCLQLLKAFAVFMFLLKVWDWLQAM